jgi:hypothetical protein
MYVRDQLEDVGVDGRKILKYILKEYVVNVWSECV